MAVVEALQGIKDTFYICSVLEFTSSCNGRLRGALGEKLFCSRCGRVYDIRCRSEHYQLFIDNSIGVIPLGPPSILPRKVSAR